MKTKLQKIALAGAAAAFMALAAGPAAAQAPAALTAGEVRKVDAGQGKVTIRHEPIQNLEMPAMTMVFRAARPELLKDVKSGDKVEFRAENVAGSYVVTEIRRAQ
jgi:Cu(I)/Ag(I) efflux system periplasmic protein CusF